MKEERMISTGKLIPSPRNPFIVEHDKAMDELIASIEREGILVPLTVRPIGWEEYEIISGHRRHYAAKEADILKVPCIIKDVTDEEADIIMVDTNLNRPHIRISEKAFAYMLKSEAMMKKRKKGIIMKRDKYGLIAPKSDEESYDSIRETADEMGVSRAMLVRYRRLAKLYKPLLDLVDGKRLFIGAGNQLSFLPVTVQQYVFEGITVKGIKMDVDMAKTLRKQFENREDATREEVYKAMRLHESKGEVKRTKISLPASMKREFFPEGYDNQKIEKIIIELLDQWVKDKENTE